MQITDLNGQMVSKNVQDAKAKLNGQPTFHCSIIRFVGRAIETLPYL
jgi:hypothetical protein